MTISSGTPPASSRRNLTGALGALLLLGTAAAGPAKAAELDGALLATFRRWLPLDDQRLAVEAMTGDEPDWDDQFDAYTDPWHDLMHQMVAMPARTPEGIHAKAQVLRALLQNHVGLGGNEKAHPSSCEELAWSLVSDLLGRTGV